MKFNWKEAGTKEESMCIMFMNQLKDMIAYRQTPDNLLYFHIANEQPQYGNNQRHMIKGRLMKLAGKLAGVLDYVFIWRDKDDGHLRVFFMEAKRPGKGGNGIGKYKALSDSQKRFVPLLDLLNIPWEVFDTPQEGLQHLQNQGIIKKNVIF